MTVPENPSGMECDLNGFQSIRYVNGHVDILYSYDVSFAVQYIIQKPTCESCTLFNGVDNKKIVKFFRFFIFIPTRKFWLQNYFY